MIIKSALSNHHIHVTREVLDILFGKNYNLNVRRMLVQKGQFAAEETVTLIKNNKKIRSYKNKPITKENRKCSYSRTL